jgi:hypothetical protein
MEETKTLLIWDCFGEVELAMYVLDPAPPWLEKCHQGYINSENTEEVGELLIRVNDALCEDPSHYTNPDDELAGEWVKHQVDLDVVPKLALGGEFFVVVCGFMP